MLDKLLFGETKRLYRPQQKVRLSDKPPKSIKNLNNHTTHSYLKKALNVLYAQGVPLAAVTIEIDIVIARKRQSRGMAPFSPLRENSDALFLPLKQLIVTTESKSAHIESPHLGAFSFIRNAPS